LPDSLITQRCPLSEINEGGGQREQQQEEKKKIIWTESKIERRIRKRN
jgi:hypothetical protein